MPRKKKSKANRKKRLTSSSEHADSSRKEQSPPPNDPVTGQGQPMAMVEDPPYVFPPQGSSFLPLHDGLTEAITSGDHQEVVRLCTEGISLGPLTFSYFACRASAYIRMKNYREAIDDATLLLEKHHSLFGVLPYYIIGLALFALDELDKCFTVVSMGLKIDSEDLSLTRFLEHVRMEAISRSTKLGHSSETTGDLSGDLFEGGDGMWLKLPSASELASEFRHDIELRRKLSKARENNLKLGECMREDERFLKAFQILASVKIVQQNIGRAPEPDAIIDENSRMIFKIVKEFVSQVPRVFSGPLANSRSKFDEKIEAFSAKMFFHFYGKLHNQQNMLQDYVRTGTYYAAVIENGADFSGRVVVDVSAGSGILSLFAAQAGARHVYAVEASEMADYARKLIAGNPSLSERITVIKGKVEEVDLPEKADILISETMGTLLVNERALESYVIARDRFLAAGGKMFPTLGRIHVAPFSDEYLYSEIAAKALFWKQHSYYGVDLTPLHEDASEGYFSQPVVDAFDPRLLVAPPIFHVIDFTKVKEEDLYEIDIPLKFTAAVGTTVHGIACWFDVLFNGSTVPRWLTTAPGSPTTRWYQLRCVLAQPFVMSGQEITGRLHMIAHDAQSYTIYLTLSAKMRGPGAEQGGILQTLTGKFELADQALQQQQQVPPDATLVQSSCAYESGFLPTKDTTTVTSSSLPPE